MHPFLKVLILSQEFYKSKKKKNCAEQQNPPRVWPASKVSHCPTPSNPPPNPGSKRPCSQTRPSLPFPLPSLRPLPIYLSTYPPLPSPLPIYQSTYVSIYLSNYLSIYLPTLLPSYLPPSRLPASPCPPPGPPPLQCTNSRFPYPSQGLFSSLSSPQALPDPSRDFFLFFPFSF